ncbi:hypothetical protein KP509_13G075900 [Ceratopteris richardii]|uniref:LysM domain-containing protein n=1 Tax=Ceratopteris richardii TaxID=49495 RepID=A0A8T2TGZ0_CERRI|nr:hypothetical protein KP509_13G075900 [Ceratopteris richardii]KAH7421791.1 hypothetical protein KP509_13G075900 [Ceratopteris richardii]
MSAGKEGKEAVAAKAAGAALAVGVVWGIFKRMKARKEEDALIEECCGENEDFSLSCKEERIVADAEAFVEEVIALAKVDLPPPPVDLPPHADELSNVPKEEITATKPSESFPPKQDSDEKPWFLKLFDSSKKTESKPKLWSKDSEVKESQSHEIKRGDTLWAISGKYGIPLAALKAANGLEGDNIYAGEKLVIPPK